MSNRKKEKHASSLHEPEEQLKSLRSISNVFDDDALAKKKKLIREVSLQKLRQPKKLFEYHQLLLFLCAYPQSKDVLTIAEAELRRVAISAKKIFDEKNERLRTQLVNTGIANTQVNVSFSFHFVKWLLLSFPDDVKLFSIDAEDVTAEQVLCSCLTDVERDLIADKMLSATKMIRRLKSANQGDLEFLVQLFSDLKVSVEATDVLWDSLKIFISWRLTTNAPSLTYAKSPKRKIFFHTTSLLKRLDWKKEIQKPLGKAYHLNEEEQGQLVMSARGTLAMFLRETDPVTYVDVSMVELFDMGRGIDIALYSMIVERRLPLESYIGYVAFKNRIPVAYGGSWIFLHRAKTGLNIFPAFRGGESAFLFIQILRLYHQYYKVKKFFIEPYQIGKNNTEGLKSGAFWFYYRLGFIPTLNKLHDVAAEEFEKIISDKNYRTPLSVMKQLSNSHLELNLSPEKPFPDFDPLLISSIANETLNKQKSSMSRSNFEVAEFIIESNKLKRDEASLLKKTFALKKSGSEQAFIFSLQKNHMLLKNLPS